MVILGRKTHTFASILWILPKALAYIKASDLMFEKRGILGRACSPVLDHKVVCVFKRSNK